MIVLLWLFFVILNGKLTLEIALIGIAVAAAASFFMFTVLGWDIKKEWKRIKNMPRMAAYLLSLLWEVFKANLDVFKRVWSGKEPQPAIVKVKRKFREEWKTALLANSITLTPGTITMRLSDDDLTVHCLDRSLADGLEDSTFERQLDKMEGDKK